MKKTYGVLRLVGSDWHVEAEPYVVIRLKRVFEKISKGRFGVVRLSNTPENCRELEWFLQRYPMDVVSPDALAAGSKAHKDEELLVADLVNGVRKPPPFELALPPREYQSVAAAIVLATGGLIIADEVGLGKTLCAIATFTDPRTLPALVVTLSHLTHQWESEVNRFAPDLRTHILKKTKVYDVRDKGVFPDVLITTYHKLHGWADTLAPVINSIVFDEGHELRRGRESLKGNAAYHLANNVSFRTALSVHPKSTVELRGGPFGSGWVGNIQAAFRSVDRPSLHHGQYEILDVSDLGVESRGWNGISFCWKSVKKMIRHPCDRPLSSAKVRGVQLRATNDHSVYVAKSATEFVETETSALQVKDIVPIDDGRGWEEGLPEESLIDVVELIEGLPTVQVAVDLSSLSHKSLGIHIRDWHRYRRGPFGTRLPLAVYRKAPYVRLSDWAYVLGFWIGDGWFDESRVCLAVENKLIGQITTQLNLLPDIGLTCKVKPTRRNSVEVRMNHKLWCLVLGNVFGTTTCYTKHIPGEWVISWPRESRFLLLQGLVDSDGTISKKTRRISYRTTSPRLMHSLLSLLRSLGINGSVTCSAPRVEEREIISRVPSYSIAWSYYDMYPDHKPEKKWGGTPGSQSTFLGNFSEGKVRAVFGCRGRRPKYVYDFEMGGHPSFVVDGMLVHNSATPFFNYGGEMFNVMEAIKPGALGTWGEFFREWCNKSYGDKKARIREPRVFGSYLRDHGLMIRRTREDVGRELPDLSKVPHYVSSDKAALDQISASAAELAKFILDQGPSLKGEKMKAAGELSYKLRQATGIAKAPYVAQFVKMLVESGEKVLLYGWHRAVYDIWQDQLSDFNPVLYSGSESPKQKQDAFNRFAGGDTNLIIMSLRSGLGLDGLQHHCKTVVVGELDWSPSVLKQCIGRVHREGQPHPVMAYYLLSNTGSDPVIADTLGIKKAQIEGVVDPNKPLIEKQRQADDIKRLAKYYLKQVKKRG
jgi:intein/homing endonuclease/superfamily II DNA or RNA helicase